MRITIRTRLLILILLGILPIVVIGAVAARQANTAITEGAANDLENLLEIEAKRLDDLLENQQTAVTRVADQRDLIDAVESLVDADLNAMELDTERSGLAVTANAELQKAAVAGQNIADLRILNRQGELLASTPGFSWNPADADLVERVMDSREPHFGDAFVGDRGEGRFGIAVPIVSDQESDLDEGSLLGALLVEGRLGPIVSLTQDIDAFGETSETFIVQRASNTTGQVITLRRFQRDAAFSAVVDLSEESPSARSLEVEGTQVDSLTDYRGEVTLAATRQLDRTGWGVVVKIDEEEAFAAARRLNRFTLAASLIAVAVVSLGWFLQFRPLSRRIRRTVEAADLIASGEYESRIDDDGRDEIGGLARGIDRLAHDLKLDIQAREKAEQRLWYQANHDALTGLKNRQHIQEVISSYDTTSDSPDFSILFLDLDGFKEINDTHGHGTGDQLLVALARRLTKALPDETLISRWGGDEFLILLEGADKDEAGVVASQLDRIIREPYATRRGQHRVGASIGVASSVEFESASDVVQAADAAMFLAKHQGRTGRSVSPATIRLIESAMADDRVEPFFQPVVRWSEGGQAQLIGAEALVRIRDEDGSFIPPGDFLPELGSHELAGALDLRVMTKSFAQLSSWHSQSIVPPDFRVSLNFGPAMMNDQTVVERLAEAIAEYGLKANWVVIEIPETVESVNSTTLHALRQLGVTLAIDDVGIAYSNLERMVDLDADIAKLDRRWVPDLESSQRSKIDVLSGLIDQCRRLGLEIIAEGVETAEQVTTLADLGVDLFQGFYFDRPVSLFDFERTWCDDFATNDVTSNDGRSA